MTIPASSIVQIIPGVVSAGGSNLVLNGVIVDQSTLIPSGSYLSFSSASAVGKYFGVSSTQYSLASIYFNGFDNATQLPQTLLFAPYAATARAAWLMGASLAGTTLSTVQAITGSLTVSVNGTAYTAASLSLSGATSFTNAASLITTALGCATVATVTWNATNSTFQLTTVATGATAVVTFATGTASAALGLSQAAGAILSQGVAADTPTTAMTFLITATTNWASFTTAWEPVDSDKLLFAAWVNSQKDKYVYVAWDSNQSPATSATATSSFGYLCDNTYNYDGVYVIGGTTAAATASGVALTTLLLNNAVFTLGAIASIDFSRTNGRITLAFKKQSGLVATCLDQTSANNLIADSYNFYGSYATANDAFTFAYPGQVAGQWKWLDPYVNQIYMNAQFQLDLVTLLTEVGSIPYNNAGYELIRASLSDTINAMIKFGAIRQGISLSSTQKAEVNSTAGVTIDTALSKQGYYLQILDPGASVRAQRGTPVINFFYMDGGAVQTISMASIAVL